MTLWRHVTRARSIRMFCLVVIGCAAAVSRVSAQQRFPRVPTVTALSVDSALAAMAHRDLWPRFEPLTTPVAIFDGTRTYVFRHPHPPAGYGPVEGRRDVMVRDGRDPAITANTSAMLGGVSTATVNDYPRGDATGVAALAVHEAFHVFQRARHPAWQANEADLFTYPVDDSVALALRREETSALSLALHSTSTDSLRCWSRAFVAVRRRRFAELGTAAAAYERGTELNEGLAQYVEVRAARALMSLSPTDASATQIRQRAYAVGSALAVVLDRARPEWRELLEESDPAVAIPLDSILAAAVGEGATPAACAPTERQRAEWVAQAGNDVRSVVAERRRTRADYLGSDGWRLVVEAGDAPFFPQGFDPLNVERLSPTEILHTRFLKLRGGTGTVEVLDGSVLTDGRPGAHPLFSGVVRVTMTGLPETLAVRDSSGVLMLDAPGIHGRFPAARADTTGRTIRIWHH